MHLYSGGLSKTAVAVVAGIACGVMVSGTAEAADKLLGYATGSYDTVIYGGFDFSHANSQQNGFGIDGGFVTAINGDITTTGWTVSANLGFSQSNDVATDTDSVSGSVLAGYQWHSPEYYFALNAGIAVVNNNDTPSGGPTDGSEVGAIVQYGFETKSGMYFVQSYGAFSTAYDQIYVHAKLGARGDMFDYGAEFTASDEEDSGGTLRYGAFINDIAVGSASVGFSAGFQQELEAGKDDGFYATADFSMPLSLH